MKLAVIILSSILTIAFAAGTFVALHTRTAGYVTFTISFGDDTMPLSLAAALPSAAPIKLSAKPAAALTEYLPPKPQRKPEAPKPNDRMPGDGGPR